MIDDAVTFEPRMRLEPSDRRPSPRRSEASAPPSRPPQQRRRGQRFREAGPAPGDDRRCLPHRPDDAVDRGGIERSIAHGRLTLAVDEATRSTGRSERYEGASRHRRAGPGLARAAGDRRPDVGGTGGPATSPSISASISSSEDRAEQDLPRRRMPEQRANQVAMVVELRGLADDRHDAVGAGQLEEAVDLAIAQPA